MDGSNFLEGERGSLVSIFVLVCARVHACIRACRGKKGALGPLELELQVIVSCATCAENRVQVLCESSRCF